MMDAGSRLRHVRETGGSRLLRSLCVAWLTTCALGSTAAEPARVLVQEAWCRQAPGTDVAAVYLTLRNLGTRPLTLVGIQSPIARSVMLHETKTEGGMSRMRPVSEVRLLPGQTVKLEPGGMHAMLQGLTQTLTAGQSVPLVLQLDDGSTVRASAQVRPF